MSPSSILKYFIVIFFISGCATVPHSTVEQAKEPSFQEKCKSKRSVIGIFLKENKSKHLEISSLVKNSPAENAQLKSGDVITKMNGTPIKSRYDFLRLLDEIPAGKSVNLTVRRHSNVIEKTVLVQEGFIYHDAKAIQSILASGRAVSKLFDGRHQIRYATEHATANTFAGDLPKPPFNKIEPRGGGRREVAMKAGMLFQPCLDLGVIVRTIVVHESYGSPGLWEFHGRSAAETSGIRCCDAADNKSR